MVGKSILTRLVPLISVDDLDSMESNYFCNSNESLLPGGPEHPPESWIFYYYCLVQAENVTAAV